MGHVEAGLRTGDLCRPFPEEAHRRLVATITRWHFAPTPAARDALLREGIDPRAVPVTGNTVVDALLAAAARPAPSHAPGPPPPGVRRVLVTLHRRETQGTQQRALCRALARLASRPDVEVLLPVHRNPAVRTVVEEELGGWPGVRLTDPLDYAAFVHTLRTSHLVVTDSGGVQEEAPSFDVPVVVLRDTTERPEGVEAGCAVLAGTEPGHAMHEIRRLLDDDEAYARMAAAPSPYGDGLAARRVVARLERDLVASQQRRLVPAGLWRAAGDPAPDPR